MITIKELIEKLSNGTAVIVGGGSIINNGKRIWNVTIEETISLNYIHDNYGYVNIPEKDYEER